MRDVINFASLFWVHELITRDHVHTITTKQFCVISSFLCFLDFDIECVHVPR